MKIEFNELHNELYKNWKEYAKAKANWEMLHESKKSVISKKASQFEWSEATRERKARASKEYANYLVWVAKARQVELELKYKIDSLNMQFEYCRSINSVKKREMNIL